MRKWIYRSGIAFATFLYILGFFDLKPITFGWYSPYFLLGMIIFYGLYFQQAIDNLKYKNERGLCVGRKKR